MHSHMHTGNRQLTRHTSTQLPAGAIVANLTPPLRMLSMPLAFFACSPTGGFPLKLLLLVRTIIKFYGTATKLVFNYCLAKGSSSENVTDMSLVALAARRSRRVRTAGHHLQVDRSRSLPRRNLGTTGVSKDRDHVKAREERTPG